MAYNKQIWTAPAGSDLNKFTKANETTTSVELTHDPTFTNTPTPFTAERMNYIESGIDEASLDKEVEKTVSLDEISSFSYSGFAALAAIACDGTDLYSVNTDDTIYKHTGITDTKTAIGTFGYSGGSNVMTMAYSNGSLYIKASIDSEDRIAEYNASTGSFITTHTVINSRAIAFDNDGNLFSESAGVIRYHNGLSDSGYKNTFSDPTDSGVNCMTYDGQNLIIYDNSEIYVVNPNTGELLSSDVKSFSSYEDLTYYDGNVYAADSTQIVKLDNLSILGESTVQTVKALKPIITDWTARDTSFIPDENAMYWYENHPDYNGIVAVIGDGTNVTASLPLMVGVNASGDFKTPGSLTVSDDADITGALSASTVDTGQGANELYAMDQNVRTTDAVTLGSLTVSGGNISVNKATGTNTNVYLRENEENRAVLYNDASSESVKLIVYTDAGSLNGGIVIDRATGDTKITKALTVSGDADITGALSASTVDTGQGANELYAMDQNVRTTDAVTLGSLTVSGGNISVNKATGTNTNVYLRENEENRAVLYNDASSESVKLIVYTDAGSLNGGIVIDRATGDTKITKALTVSGDGISEAGDILPIVTNTNDIGSSSLEYKDIYLVNSPTVSSDARIKTEKTLLTDTEKAAGREIKDSIGIYKLLASIEEKGEKARYHVGCIVQEVMEIFKKHNLDPFKYGIVCHTEWDTKTIEHPAEPERIEKEPLMETVQVEKIVEENGKYIKKTVTEERQKTKQVDLYDEAGNIIGTHTVPEYTEKIIPAKEAWTETVREAGDLYSFRYTELMMFIIGSF